MLYQTLFVVILFRILHGMGFHDLKVSFLIHRKYLMADELCKALHNSSYEKFYIM